MKGTDQLFFLARPKNSWVTFDSASVLSAWYKAVSVALKGTKIISFSDSQFCFIVKALHNTAGELSLMFWLYWLLYGYMFSIHHMVQHSHSRGLLIGNPEFSQILSYKSVHPGLSFSISSSFHLRSHFFIRFSLVIADSAVLCISYQTRWRRLYFFVKPSTSLFLCSQVRLIIPDVTPVYKVPFRLLQSIYT